MSVTTQNKAHDYSGHMALASCYCIHVSYTATVHYNYII